MFEVIHGLRHSSRTKFKMSQKKIYIIEKYLNINDVICVCEGKYQKEEAWLSGMLLRCNPTVSRARGRGILRTVQIVEVEEYRTSLF